MKRLAVNFALLLAALAALSAVPDDLARAATPPDVTESDVYSFFDADAHGTSVLRRTDNVLTMSLSTGDLPPGAYTCWWLVFNNPEGCVHGPGRCGEDPADFAPGGPAGFGFYQATHAIVGEDGEAVFAANLVKGETLMDDNGDLNVPFADPRTAEVILIVRYHGPVDPERLYQQTHTGEFGDPDVFDVQFSVHAAP